MDEFDRCTPRHPPDFTRRDLRWSGPTGLGVVGRATIHPGARSASGWKDIFPGHTQYFAESGRRRLDLDETRRDAGDSVGTGTRRLDISLRPEWRSRMSAWCRAHRLVTVDIRLELGRCGRHSRLDGPCSVLVACKPARTTGTTCQRATFDAVARGCRVESFHEGRSSLDSPP